MSDYDRDREPVGEREPIHEPIHDIERTTIVQTDRGGGGSGVLVAVVILIALLALLYFLFGGGLNKAADEVGVNVNIGAPTVSVPDVKMPDININVPDNIQLPDIDVKTKDAPAEKK